jgi:crotonobetainyl-CoA:carnitine CoA-transferase CaiB-like acyl-CoA transferase
MVVEVDLPGGQKVKQPGHPIRYSATPPAYGRAGVGSGVHTREVLLDLGYSDNEIDEFEKTGLFG